MSDEPIFELRTDPVMGRKVYISEGRAGRPTDYAGFSARFDQQASSKQPAHCPFCAGNENETPPASMELQDDAGRWQVRVVPNKFPAVRQMQDSSLDGGPSANGTALSPDGAHEVIVESPQHVREITALSLAEYEQVLGVYRLRVRYWNETAGIRQVMLFKNVGFAAGASLEHVHSQIIAVPYVWDAVEMELAGALEFHKQQGSCVYCDLIARESSAGTRVVLENEHFLACTAFAGRQPYETWIVPKLHASDFHLIGDDELASLAELLHDLVARLQTCLTRLAYNLVLHTAPVGGKHADTYHWHWELIPRSTRLAGLEFGSGAHINPLSPERAASFLRNAKC